MHAPCTSREEDSWEPKASVLDEALLQDFEASRDTLEPAPAPPLWNLHPTRSLTPARTCCGAGCEPPPPPLPTPAHRPYLLWQAREARREALLAKSSKGKSQKVAKRKGSSFLRF